MNKFFLTTASVKRVMRVLKLLVPKIRFDFKIMGLHLILMHCYKKICRIFNFYQTITHDAFYYRSRNWDVTQNLRSNKTFFH